MTVTRTFDTQALVDVAVASYDVVREWNNTVKDAVRAELAAQDVPVKGCLVNYIITLSKEFVALGNAEVKASINNEG